MSFTKSGTFPANYYPLNYFPALYFPLYSKERFDNAKELAIWTWASTSSGITAIWDKPGEPRPTLPYITLNVSPSRPIAKVDTEYLQQDTYRYNFKKEITLTVNVIADNQHILIAEKLIDSLEIPVYRAILRQGGLAIWRASPAIDISELIDTDFENRAEFDVILSYNESSEQIPGEVDDVTYEGTLGTFTITGTVNKP